MPIAAIIIFMSCNSTRYVPTGEYLLKKNVVQLKNPETLERSLRLDKNVVAEYIQQRPNRRILGLNFALGIYNISDTSRHTKWRDFWQTKLGEPPVIFDSMTMDQSIEEMTTYLEAKGYLKAKVEDSLKLSDRKATVYYQVKQGEPYLISEIKYQIEDKFLNQLILADTVHSLIRPGGIFDWNVLENEQTRITNNLRNDGFYSFGKNFITYRADTTKGDNTVALTLVVKQRVAGMNARGEQIMENHPIYRISKITINSDFDPTKTISSNSLVQYDTTEYNYIKILYVNKMYIRKEVLVNALRISPYLLYNQKELTQTYNNIRALGYTANISFTPAPEDKGAAPVMVTIAGADGGDISTSEQLLECLIQLTPNIRQSITQSLELSTTSDYFSAALTLSYQNRNLLGGAEDFSASFRGAYEFVKSKGQRNSYEFGVNTSIQFPRFLLPLSKNLRDRFQQPATRLTLNYNVQQRPNYHRSLISAVYGYSWNLQSGARFTINPVDVNYVNVPWVADAFLNDIENPYLRNSYNSQMIAGLSFGYFYNQSPNFLTNGWTVRGAMDLNGNLLSLISTVARAPWIEKNGERYHRMFGLRYAQYARASFEVANRFSISSSTQVAWRFYIGGGLPYGNSGTVPFERLYYAGGSNSMRGWPLRALGPGSVAIDNNKYETDADGNIQVVGKKIPNQLGDFRLEGNVEIRQDISNGINLALFFDAGNIWMNSRGAKPEERFRFDRFYRQIAFNTGLGFRWNLDFVLFRLDWGLKLHNPNLPQGERWFKDLALKNSAFHFAIGLPF